MFFRSMPATSGVQLRCEVRRGQAENRIVADVSIDNLDQCSKFQDGFAQSNRSGQSGIPS
jgi:hypothetical protein